MSEKKPVVVAAVQASFNGDLKSNVDKATALAAQAVKAGAQIILLPELFEGPYFCTEERDHFFQLAKPAEEHPTISHFRKFARQHRVVIPVSFFEKDRQAFYNSIAIVNADGAVMGIYRKSHIPDGPGYEEKFYFRPGNSGFKVWETAYGIIGVGICWDQWFPECARSMVLMGADLLFYPTAIGSEPKNPSLDTKDPWQRAMIGHAVSNACPVVAANRIGTESAQTFYGHSFIADTRGEKVAELGRNEEGVITAPFDLTEVRKDRASWGFFRDRRPDLYSILQS